MGNLDRRPTRGITGAMGPALVLRAIFAELDRDGETGSFSTWAWLECRSICAVTGMLAGPGCPRIEEKFQPGGAPVKFCSLHSTSQPVSMGSAGELNNPDPVGAGPAREPDPAASRVNSSASSALRSPSFLTHPSSSAVRLLQPSAGLQIAVDPRIPGELQAFAFEVSEAAEPDRIEWVLNGERAGVTGKGIRRFLWPLSRGEFTLLARVWEEGRAGPVETPLVAFVVK